MTRVKICGLTNKEDALMAVNAGADVIGAVNIKESKRYITLEKARELFECLPVFVSKVVVAIPKNLKEALKIERTGANYIQLQGDESVDFIKKLKRKSRLGIIKKISVSPTFSRVNKNCLQNAKRYSRFVDAILLDTKVEGLSGGTGLIQNWKISQKVVKSLNKPVILAGGLNPKNLKMAIKKVNPYAVDTSSGVEEVVGKKDKKKVEEFIKIAKPR